MKIIKNTLCAAVLFTGSMSAQAAIFNMGITPTSTFVTGVGETFDVDIFGSYTADVNGADQLLGGAVDLLYDPSIIVLHHIIINAPDDISNNVDFIDNVAGLAQGIGFASFSGIDQSDGVISYATVRFGTVGVGTSTLELRDANNLAYEWVNTNLDTVDLSLTNGSVRVGSPVPLPAASWLFASGLIGLFQINRKKVRA